MNGKSAEQRLAEGILQEISEGTHDVKCWNLAVTSYTDWKKRFGQRVQKNARPFVWRDFVYDMMDTCDAPSNGCAKNNVLKQWSFVKRFIANFKDMFGKPDACATIHDIWNCLQKTSWRAFSKTWGPERAVAIAMAIDLKQDKIGLFKGMIIEWYKFILGCQMVIKLTGSIKTMVPEWAWPVKILSSSFVDAHKLVFGLVSKVLFRKSGIKGGQGIVDAMFEDPAPTDRFDPSRPCGKNSHTDPRGYDREKIVAIAKKYGIGTSKNKTMSQLCQEVREKHRALHPDKAQKKKKVRRRVN
jgi:hypothetical protein